MLREARRDVKLVAAVDKGVNVNVPPFITPGSEWHAVTSPQFARELWVIQHMERDLASGSKSSSSLSGKRHIRTDKQPSGFIWFGNRRRCGAPSVFLCGRGWGRAQREEPVAPSREVTRAMMNYSRRGCLGRRLINECSRCHRTERTHQSSPALYSMFLEGFASNCLRQ